ncbi:hypothetical protein GE107_18700 [Cohnella sp. CFH 77786]|uniref:DUF6886 family protein n=1 Tax=Cohnella sp. CFH 77786 TaxID=2662265 RepID=UPI001C60C579|nr:DUF6886 family protein [Cohnella sp. CFH 77786]MBW5448091.1 hypothetical protein [Cohnella sp. CFH 77786]
MELYHFSSDPNIEVFKPRVKHNRQDMPPIVWAIDKEHEFTFFFPRDCPRIVYTRTPDISEEDEIRFFGTTNSNIVISVETHWFHAINTATIFKYTLPGQSFKLFDEIAGYYISEQTIEPMAMEPISKLTERLMEHNIEIRWMTNLNPLREAILKSTIKDFGIHRFENAKKQ